MSNDVPVTVLPGPASRWRDGRSREVSIAGLVLGTLAAAVLSAAVNSAVRLGAVAAFDVPSAFEPLAAAAPAQASVVAAVGAGAVLALLQRFTSRPLLWFGRISVTVLLLSFVPLALLAAADPPQYPGTNAESVGTLALMHVVAFAATVPVLTRVAKQ
jgi:hypothetical protein